MTRPLFVALLLGCVCSCAEETADDDGPPASPFPEALKTLEVTSPAFAEGETIPETFTCEGKDVSPGLAWSGVPDGAKSIAVICRDPDAPGGTWYHWLLYNLPAETTSLPEGVPAKEELESGALQGENDFPSIGYRGPCPPAGKPHRYVFLVVALNAKLELAAGARSEDVLETLDGNVVAWGMLTGLYERE